MTPSMAHPNAMPIRRSLCQPCLLADFNLSKLLLPATGSTNSSDGVNNPTWQVSGRGQRSGGGFPLGGAA